MKPEDEDHDKGPGLLASRSFWIGGAVASAFWIGVLKLLGVW